MLQETPDFNSMTNKLMSHEIEKKRWDAMRKVALMFPTLHNYIN